MEKLNKARMKRSTISQQNQAYGIHGGVKRSMVTQQNEAYGLTKTGMPALAFSIPNSQTSVKRVMSIHMSVSRFSVLFLIGAHLA